MPLHIRDRIVLAPDLKVKFLSLFFSAIAYGIVVVLSGNCFHLLLKKRGIYSNRTRILLIIYIIIMLLCSTWTLIGSIHLIMRNLTRPHHFGLASSFGLPFIMWGADGFMIWRFLVLYQDVSRGPRVVIIVLLSLISLASFVFGVAMLVEDVKFMSKLSYADEVFISLSALVNIILAALIVSRLIYHRRYVRNTLGAEHGSPYTNVITMCVESSALMVIASGLYTVLSFVSWPGQSFMMDITPHIYVISPLLIVYRVALGRAIPSTLLPSEQVMAQIEVNIPVSNPSGQEGEV